MQPPHAVERRFHPDFHPNAPMTAKPMIPIAHVDGSYKHRWSD